MQAWHRVGLARGGNVWERGWHFSPCCGKVSICRFALKTKTQNNQTKPLWLLTWPQLEKAHSTHSCWLQAWVSTGLLASWVHMSLDTGVEIPDAFNFWQVTRRVWTPPPQLRVQADQEVTIHLRRKQTWGPLQRVRSGGNKTLFVLLSTCGC